MRNTRLEFRSRVWCFSSLCSLFKINFKFLIILQVYVFVAKFIIIRFSPVRVLMLLVYHKILDVETWPTMIEIEPNFNNLLKQKFS